MTDTGLTFERHTDCNRCELHEQCDSVGIRTRHLSERPTGVASLVLAWGKLESTPVASREKALLVIGEAPGKDEDMEGMSWVGWTGRTLYRWLVEVYELPEVADVYLSNAVRCRPPANDTPTRTLLNACRKYLHEDIQQLRDAYGPTNVTILCLGAPAVDTILRTSIRRAAATQGALHVPYGSEDPDFAMPVFVSYHPAAMAPGRSPDLLGPFDAHIKRLKSFLAGTENAPQESPTPQIAPKSLSGSPSLVGLDIETYGILRDKEQTVFHPARSAAVDGVPVGRQVVSVAVAWWDEGGMHTGFYDFRNKNHRSRLWAALSALPQGACLTGMNIKFDVLYLKENCSALSLLLRRSRFRLEDLSVLNHLVSDTRPERSLKALAGLYSIADYSKLIVSTLPTGQKAKSSADPNLIRYNCLDARASLELHKTLTDAMRADEWPTLDGFDPHAFRSDLVWTVVHMEQVGIRFDLDALCKLRTQFRRRVDRTIALGKALGYTLSGKGSMTSKSPASRQGLLRAAFQEAVAANPSESLDRRIVLTKKTKDISTDKSNVYLLLFYLPKSSPMRRAVRCYQRFQKAEAILSSYLTPLLENRTAGCLPTGRAYPSWYMTPANVKDDAGKEGGTRQARFAAHRPAAQTFPPIIRPRMSSRYSPGVLLAYDLSQIELRMAALLSGDPVMLDAYANGEDLHYITAQTIWPELSLDHPEYNSRRQLGKKLNFLRLYRGKARRFREAAFHEMGLILSWDFANAAIEGAKKKYARLWGWQNELIDAVSREGRMVLPTGWVRTFFPDKDVVESTYVNEICNFPVQALSGQVMQDVQNEILRRREDEHLTFVMPTNTHDDFVIDAPQDCMAQADALATEVLSAPPLWGALCRTLGRDVPIDFERKTLSRRAV